MRCWFQSSIAEVGVPSHNFRFDRFELHAGERQLLKGGVPLPLRPQTFDVLVVLLDRAGHLVTKRELLQRVWGRIVVEENTLQAHVSALRKVLGPAAISTVSGHGYRFALDVTTHAPRLDGPQGAAPNRHNLPLPLTRFIGRERMIADIRQHLSSVRLLTLTGAGGCGKTRLALEVAGQCVDDHPDGVWLVELARLAEPTLLPQAVAKALAVEAQPGEDVVETLIQRLSARHVLLLLDNAEHLVEICAALADRLLSRCRGLTILATSRERLGITGELTYRVPPLSTPTGEAGEDVQSTEAVRLFVDRARLHCPAFELADSQHEALVSICRRLDGIALAIELAAPLMRMMSLEAIRQRLDDRFALLSDGPPTALPHHRTLRSAIDWSHELLAAREKVLLRRVAVFAGGWTLESAEHVCSGHGIEAHSILGLLAALVDKSLVVVDTSTEPTRFGMLESVRQYAQARLSESGEEALPNDRLVGYLVTVSEGLESTGSDDTVQQTLLRLDAEHDNLRAALAWCAGDPARALTGLRLAAGLSWFWQIRAHIVEGRAWLARLLAVAPAGDDEVLAMALNTSGGLANWQCDFPGAAAAFREAVALRRCLGDRRRLAHSLGSLGMAEKNCGRLQAARALFEETLAIAREIQQERSIALALKDLGEVACLSGDFDAAEAFLQEGLQVARAVGPWVTGHTLAQIGMLEHQRGNLPRARAAMTQGLEALRQFGDRTSTAMLLRLLAMVVQDQGKPDEARSLLWEALEHYKDLWFRLAWLDTFAGLLATRLDAHSAAHLWGCVQGQLEKNRWPREERWRQTRLQDAARRGLRDPTPFDEALNEGRAWTVDEAMARARAFDSRLDMTPHRSTA